MYKIYKKWIYTQIISNNKYRTKLHRTKPHIDKTPSVIFSSGQNPTLQFSWNYDINDQHNFIYN